MPTVTRTRTIEASPQDVWEVLSDPHHLPRWWPRVSRVEAVTLKGTGELQGVTDGEAPPAGGGGHPEGHKQGGVPRAFTEVLTSAKGKIVRADFQVLDAVAMQRIVWAQELENTPFAKVLRSAETEIGLADAPGAHGPCTEVTIELRQELQGFMPKSGRSSWISGVSRFGSPLVRRAALATVEEALDGLERIVGR